MGNQATDRFPNVGLLLVYPAVTAFDGLAKRRIALRFRQWETRHRVWLIRRRCYTLRDLARRVPLSDSPQAAFSGSSDPNLVWIHSF